MNEYETHEGYTNTQKLSLYVGYILVLIKEKVSFEFLIKDYKDLIKNGDLEEYRELLRVEFHRFSNDIEFINKHI